MNLMLSINSVKKSISGKVYYTAAIWMFALTSVYSIVAGLLLSCSIGDVLLNILFQFFLMTVPGLAVTASLFKEKKDPIFIACLSYAFGYAIIILEYFSAMLFGREYSLPTALLVFVLSCCLLWWKKSDLKKIRFDEKVPAVYLVIFFILLVASFFCFSAKNGGVNLLEVTSISTDNQFWLSNASALSITFRPESPRMSGTYLYYYFFSCLPLAFQSNVTGMSVYSLGTVFYALPKSLLLFGGVYAVLTGLRVSKKSVIFGLITCLFTTGIEALTLFTVVTHMMLVPFGYDVGIGCCCWMLYFVIEQYHKKDFDYKLCIVAVLFMFTATGTKAPAAMTFMIAAGIICFGWFFGKEYKKAFGYGISFLFAFVSVMFTFVLPISSFFASSSSSGALPSGGFHPFQILIYNNVSSSFYYSSFYNTAPRLIALITMSVLFLLSDPLPVFFELVGVCHLAKWKKARNSVFLGLAISVMIGLFMGLFWKHDDKSNMYYAMTARVLAILFGVCLFDKEISDIKLVPSRNFSSLLSVILCFQVFLFSFVGYNEGCLRSMYRGARIIVDAYTDNVGDFEYFNYYYSSINRDKVEALEWIRQNTDKDSHIATNESLSVNSVESSIYSSSLSKYMYTPVFSERITYMEGCAYTRNPKSQEEVFRRADLLTKMYQNDQDALLQLKKEGVDYIVCNRREFPFFNPPSEYVVFVYRNKSISIYKLK